MIHMRDNCYISYIFTFRQHNLFSNQHKKTRRTGFLLFIQTNYVPKKWGRLHRFIDNLDSISQFFQNLV